MSILDRFRLDGKVAIVTGASSGLGVAFVSRPTVARELGAGELATVRVRGLDLTRSLYAVYHRRRPLSPPGAAFLQFLKAHPLTPDRR